MPTDPQAAAEHINEAREENQGYQPANILAARMMLANGDIDNANAALQLVYKDEKNGSVTPEVELLACEVTARSTTATKDEKAAVAKKLEDLKAKGVDPVQIGRVAAYLSPDLPEQLGVPAPEGAAPPDDHGKKKHH
jgi:uncharacterized membrane-anchored protein